MKIKTIISFTFLLFVSVLVGAVCCNYLRLPMPTERTFSFPPSQDTYGEIRPQIIKYAYSGECDLLKNEIDQGVDVNERFAVDQPWAGYTPLAGAIYANSFDCVKTLLDAGADIQASFQGPLSFWNIFFNRNFNCRNTYSLAFALYKKADIQIIKLLIEHGAPLNGSHNPIYLKNGLTPLMLAIITGNKEAFKLLLQAGADPDIKNDIDNLSARDYASIYDILHAKRSSFQKDFSSSLEKYKK